MSQAEYTARINRVIDHIDGHLDQELTLEDLARVAAFSPFHFHRIFAVMTGETLGRYIQRLRLEKAAMLLLHNLETPVTNIALDTGFSSSATFARAFRNHFGCTASEWRAAHDPSRLQAACEDVPRPPPMALDVTVRDLPEMHVAYVRYVGPYKGDADLFEGLWGQLCKWAGPRGLINPPETQALSVYHDDPEVTDQQNLRVSVCFSVPADTEVSGEIGKMTLHGGRYALARCELGPEEYQLAWSSLYGAWLPDSGYQPDDRPAYEWFHGDPKDHPEGKATLDICMPVKPL